MILALRFTGIEGVQGEMQAEQGKPQRQNNRLRDYGLKFVMTSNEVDWKEMEDIRDRASAALQKSGYIPAQLVTRTNALISEYRDRKQQAAESQ